MRGTGRPGEDVKLGGAGHQPNFVCDQTQPMYTSVPSLSQLHVKQTASAADWAKMLLAPQDESCYAPSNTPFLASRTRFVKAVDIPYSQTSEGLFTVAQLPNAQAALAVSSSTGNIPEAPGDIQLNSFKATSPNEGYIDSGLLVISNANTGDILGTTRFADLGALDALLAGTPGVAVDSDAGSSFDITLKPENDVARKHYYKIGLVTTAYTINYQAVASPGEKNHIELLADMVGFVVAVCGHDGTIHTDDTGALYSIESAFYQGQVPGLVSTESFDLVRTDLIEAGRVGNQRCTAMSLLITNMAAPLVAGGELVIGRCPVSILSSGQSDIIMNTIKQLPEELYWRSGPIKEGGYTWWLPDDLESYEPHPIGDQLQPENVLVASGRMSEAGGFVRVIATWVFEFYTPVQLFSRDYTLTYSRAHHDMWHLLSQMSAVSANMGHLALVAAGFSLANQVYQFYTKHQKAIDSMVAAGAGMVNSYVGARRKKQEQKKSKPPQSKQSQKPAPSQAGQPSGHLRIKPVKRR